MRSTKIKLKKNHSKSRYYTFSSSSNYFIHISMFKYRKFLFKQLFIFYLMLFNPSIIFKVHLLYVASRSLKTYTYYCHNNGSHFQVYLKWMLKLYSLIKPSLCKVLKFPMTFYHDIATCIEAFLLFKNYEPIFHFLFLCFVLLSFLLKHFFSKPYPIYLIDFSCLKPPNHCRVPFSTFLENTSLFECYDNESISFMENVLLSSGLSEETFLPPSLHYTTFHQKQNIQNSSKNLTWLFSLSWRIF